MNNAIFSNLASEFPKVFECDMELMKEHIVMDAIEAAIAEAGGERTVEGSELNAVKSEFYEGYDEVVLSRGNIGEFVDSYVNEVLMPYVESFL